MDPHSTRTADDVRSRILRAALRELVAHGTRQLKSSKIAMEAGTSESTMFRHYGDVAGVIQAVYDDCWGRLNAYLYDANSRDPGFGDPADVIAKEFDHLWTLKDDPAMRDTVRVAMTYYRRPLELGAQYVSGNQKRFEDRVAALCQGLLQMRQSTASPRALQELLTNFAATVFLTWFYLPQDENDLTTDAARLGVMSMLSGYTAKAGHFSGSGNAA